MIELVKYFRILFLSAKISRERLKAFAQDHIQRLTVNNPGGIFDTILANVMLAYTAYFGDLSDESVNQAIQEGKTVAVNDSRTALEKNLKDNEKLIAFTYKDDLPTYEEFYPLGMTEYYDADLPTLETIGNRYDKILDMHDADFPLAFIAAYKAALLKFTKSRAAQQTAMGSVAGERSDLVATKLALCTQLTTNVLTIALQYVGNESKADVYFNQAILNAAFKEGETKVESGVNPGDTQNVFDNIISPETQVRITVLGSGKMLFGFASTADTAITSDTGKEVEGGSPKTFTSAELGFTIGVKTFLNVTNNDAIVLEYIAEKV